MSEITDRDVQMFLRGMQYLIAVGDNRPKGMSRDRAQRLEFSSLGLRDFIRKGKENAERN